MQIHELPAQTTAANADVLAVDNGTSTQKITAQNFKKYAIGSTSISGIGDGTVTSAIKKVNGMTSEHNFTQSSLSAFTAAVDTYVGDTYGVFTGYIALTTASAMNMHGSGHYCLIFNHSATFRMVVAFSIDSYGIAFLHRGNSGWASSWRYITTP